MIGRGVLGFAVGFLWFVVLSGAEGLRLESMQRGTVPFTALFLALVVSALAVWLLGRARLAMPVGATLAILLSLALGFLLEDPLSVSADPTFFAVPSGFGRGAGSLAVWTALGVALALTAVPSRRRGARARRRSRAEPATARAEAR